MDSPDRVKRIIDSFKQKLENSNKLTLKQFNRQLKSTTTSETASFPFHPTITKKNKKSLESHDFKVTSPSGTTLRDLLTKTKTTPPPHLTPNVINEISAVWRKPDRFAFKANVPFSNGTFPFQMERSLPKGNVRFSTGTFASQRERSLHKGNVPFSNGTFASQMERSLPKGNVRFSKGMFFIFQNAS